MFGSILVLFSECVFAFNKFCFQCCKPEEGVLDYEMNKVRHAQIIQNIWNIVIKSIRTIIYIMYKNE
jgi:hypothetical protein